MPIRMASGARPVTREQMPKIYNMLENLCISRGITMPQFEIIDSPALNAFASGINEETYRITLTRGIIEALQDDELEAVIAHELKSNGSRRRNPRAGPWRARKKAISVPSSSSERIPGPTSKRSLASDHSALRRSCPDAVRATEVENSGLTEASRPSASG